MDKPNDMLTRAEVMGLAHAACGHVLHKVAVTLRTYEGEAPVPVSTARDVIYTALQAIADEAAAVLDELAVDPTVQRQAEQSEPYKEGFADGLAEGRADRRAGRIPPWQDDPDFEPPDPTAPAELHTAGYWAGYAAAYEEAEQH